MSVTEPGWPGMGSAEILMCETVVPYVSLDQYLHVYEKMGYEKLNVADMRSFIDERRKLTRSGIA